MSNTHQDGDSVVFSDGEKDAVVPFCLANFFSLEVLCKAPSANANKGSAPLFKDTNLDFQPSKEFCSKLGSTLVQFDCEAVKNKVPGISVARCKAFNEARTTLLNNCPTVSIDCINEILRCCILYCFVGISEGARKPSIFLA